MINRQFSDVNASENHFFDPRGHVGAIIEGRFAPERGSMRREAHGVLTLRQPQRERHDGGRALPALLPRALTALCLIGEPMDMPWNDRVAGIADPYGNKWWLATFKGQK